MDGDDMRKDKWRKFLKQKQFMFAAGLMVVAAAGMTGIYVSEQTNRNEQYEQKAEPDGEKYVTRGRNRSGTGRGCFQYPASGSE